MKNTVEIFSDGACSGNPGNAAIGVILKHNGKILQEISKGIGCATNNIAEYTAVVYGLQEALILRASEVIVNTDSALIFNQCAGKFKVKDAGIKLLVDQIQHLARGFKSVKFSLIPREQNKAADRLAKKAIKKEQTKVVALQCFCGEESPSSKG